MSFVMSWFGQAIFYSPDRFKRALAWLLAVLWFDVFRIRRRVALDNLKLAFPEKTDGELVVLARSSLKNLGLSLIEYSWFAKLDSTSGRALFRVHNLELFEKKMAEGRGVLLLTLHMGNGDLACAGLSVLGYPMVMVSKFFKFKWLNDLWFGMRERLGVKFVGPRNSSYALLRALKNGSAVVIPLDQFTGPPIGVRTTFFGQETGTAAGLAVMAMRSGAPVLAVYTVREMNGQHGIYFVKEIPVESSKSPEAVSQLTQRFNDQLEQFVRLHPDQWMWIHKRWKRFVV